MKTIRLIGALVGFSVLAACSSSNDDLENPETTSTTNISTVAPSSAKPMITTRSAPRTTRQAASFAEQFDQMTSASCKEDVSPAECMYERLAYLDFFERSAMQTLDSSYHESVTGMVGTLRDQHHTFVSQGCLVDSSSQECSVALMLSDVGMTALGVMFSAR
jgi:hypothetical protein